MTTPLCLTGAVDGQGQTFYRDWDYFISSFRTLKLYFDQQQLVPTWNMLLCGGKPELANPQSYAFTWPSAFIYALPPYGAILALWLTLTVVGWVSSWALFKRLGAASRPAAVAATLYVANGYFASHFNQGQVTFCFFHLVPLLLLMMHRALAQLNSGQKSLASLFGVAGVTFLLITSGLPHALFYFYPAVPLALLVWLLTPVGASSVPFSERVRGVVAVGLFHSLGVWLAAYKIWPVVAWQMRSPRQGVVDESLSLTSIVQDLLHFTPDYHELLAQVLPDQTWFAWEYNAYVGPGTLAMIALGAVAYLRRRRAGGAAGSTPEQRWSPATVLGIVFAAAGILLAFGNGSVVGPAALFKYLPLVRGIRVFGRFQVLLVFGICLVAAHALTELSEALGRALALPAGGSRRRDAIWLALAMVVLAGPLTQTAVLVSNVETIPDPVLAERFGLAPAATPRLVPIVRKMEEGYTYQDYVLRQGYYVTNCYEPLTLARAPLREAFQKGVSWPLSVPEPAAGPVLTAAGLALPYGAGVSDIALNFVVGQDFASNVPLAFGADGKAHADGRALAGQPLRLSRPATDERLGLGLTGLGLLGLAAAMVWRRRAEAAGGR